MSLSNPPIQGQIVQVEERIQKLWSEWIALYFSGAYVLEGIAQPQCLFAVDDLQPQEVVTTRLPVIRMITLDARESAHWGESLVSGTAGTSGDAGTSGTGRLFCRDHITSFQVSQRYQGSDDEGRIAHNVRRVASGLYFLLTHRGEPRTLLLERGISNLCVGKTIAQSAMNASVRTLGVNFTVWIER